MKTCNMLTLEYEIGGVAMYRYAIENLDKWK